MTQHLADIETIVWIQTSFLGDIVLSTAAFNALKAEAPHIRQVLITTPIGKAALKDHPSIDEVVVFDKGGKSFWQASRAVKQSCSSLDKSTTVILQAHRSFRSSLLSLRLGFQRITYGETSLSWNAQTVSRVASLHESARIGLLLEPLGVSREAICKARMSLPKSMNEHLSKRLLPLNRPLIGVAPGSVWGTKRWPAEKYGDLVKKALDAGQSVVLLGSGGEREQADIVSNMVGDHDQFLNLVGKTNLDDLRYLIPSLDVLVCNDSSPIHYGSAFGVPTLAIFGATVPAMGFGPRAMGSRVVDIPIGEVPCRPCSDHGPKVCPLEHFQCMRKIDTDAVFVTLQQMIDENSPQSLLAANRRNE
ncbi:glycosyltransferase family 9 protein [Pseudobacteriovorax antillogorgiicola]|uniref:Heptosyltransferase-2 n=1 Tax=Pseudobacteriovorax antillogorgiicola TaxID=1513793 RepID=A0A1Y6CN39_9BACT|nr:glycosyltransferase family 9 protein [Pseudobacteriovorax antillogorgiicola]TCS44430.1 heptosyltransferase-2 [Pseudobacteriovorax antillogorgiicola]SMF78973.1 heptosyltransferase-2 [Pseudobacteriovorax antillogorgiicola]